MSLVGALVPEIYEIDAQEQKFRNSKPAPHYQKLPTRVSQRDSQDSKVIADSDLQRVIEAWRNLPTNLKAAIVSIACPDCH